MSPTRLLLFSALGLGGLLVFAGTAKASSPEPEPLPPQAPNPSAPADDMPWMRYSETTLERQEEYNEWAPSHGWSTIKADGILGPETCKAFTNWQIEGGPAVPSACSNAARFEVCRQAEGLRTEYFRLEERIASGNAFSSDEEHLGDLFNEIAKLERMCGQYVLTGTGTRI